MVRGKAWWDDSKDCHVMRCAGLGRDWSHTTHHSSAQQSSKQHRRAPRCMSWWIGVCWSSSHTNQHRRASASTSRLALRGQVGRPLPGGAPSPEPVTDGLTPQWASAGDVVSGGRMASGRVSARAKGSPAASRAQERCPRGPASSAFAACSGSASQSRTASQRPARCAAVSHAQVGCRAHAQGLHRCSGWSPHRCSGWNPHRCSG